MEQALVRRTRSSFCVLTRAQNSELPYLDSFVLHYIERLRFDRIFVIYCDHRDPDDFISAAKRRHGGTVEVLLPPKDVPIGRVFDLFLDRVRAFDYCLNVDFDEFLAVKEANVHEWLEALDHPRSIELPWLNVSYLGPPAESFDLMAQAGSFIPNNHVKSFSATRTIERIDGHHIAHADRSGLDLAVQWLSDGRPFPRIAHPIGERILAATLEPFDGDISQRRTAAHRKEDPAAFHREDDFAFVAHFHVRGPADLIMKTMYQNFPGPDRGPGRDLAGIFRSDPADLTMGAVPSRFKYALASGRLIDLSKTWQDRLGTIAAARLGPLPIDLDLQSRYFIAGLTACGLTGAEARAIWDSGAAARLYDVLDRRFSPLFDAAAIRQERGAILRDLTTTFGERIATDRQLAVLTDATLRRAFREAVDRGLSGSQRVDYIVWRAAERMRSGPSSRLLGAGAEPDASSISRP